MQLMLISPSVEWEDQIMEYKKEFEENNDSMDGTAGLGRCRTFEEWYNNVISNSDEATVMDGFVPASTFLAVRIADNRLIGMIDIRHRLNEYLYNFGGNIGYSVRESERRKGYAAEMLALGLDECKKLGLSRVLITCHNKNIASAKVMLKNGAVMENEISDSGGDVVQRYFIELN